MLVQSFLKWTAMAVLIVVVGGCEQEPLQLQNGNGAGCVGCPDPGPGGGGTIGQPPVISSFSPQQGMAGTTVTINGSRFSATPAYNIVRFNGIQASVISATTIKLIVSVPSGDVTGKISVTVSGLQGVSATDFEGPKDIPRNGLVAYYPFTGNGNEMGNNNSALNFNFALPGSPTFTQDRFGRSSRALNFSPPQIASTGAQVIPQNPWTISFWINYGSLQGSSGCIATMSSSLGMQFNYYQRGGGLYGVHANGDTGPEAGGGYILSDHTDPGYLPAAGTGWIHVTMTYDGATYKAYKDGILVETNAVAVTTVPGPHLLLGRSGSTYYTGQMDDVIIYNRVVTATEVTQLFQQTISKF
jgi:hypothetical protein